MFRGIRTFRKREDGIVAVEFALLAIPFFTLLMGLIEISLYFAAGNILEGGTAEAARLIRTGQAQLSEDPETTFREELCDKLVALVDCDAVQYEVIRVEPNTFGGAEDYVPEFDENGDLIPAGFATGNSNDVVIVRTFYKYNFLTPFLAHALSGTSEGWGTHMSTAVIKAEPYNFGEE